MNPIYKMYQFIPKVRSMLFPTIQCVSKADLSVEGVVAVASCTYFLVIHNNTANPID